MLKNYHLRQVLQKQEASRRFLKWAIELGQFDIDYKPRTEIKGQALADFIAEFTYYNTTKVVGTTDIADAMKEVEMKGDGTTTKRLEVLGIVP